MIDRNTDSETLYTPVMSKDEVSQSTSAPLSKNAISANIKHSRYFH